MDSQPKIVTVEEILGRTGSRGGITQVRVVFVEDSKRKLSLSLVNDNKKKKGCC